MCPEVHHFFTAFQSCFILIFSYGILLNAQEKKDSFKLLSVQKIWDKAPHNAFTDLIWHNNAAFNFGYGCGEKKSLRLYKSSDGRNFETLVEDLNIDSYPNETSIVFKGDTAFCLLRRDGENKSGLLGISIPPFTSWSWKDLGVRIGGPDMILLPDGRSEERRVG